MFGEVAQQWDKLSSIPPLAEKDVHIWQADLDQHSRLTELRNTLLSYEEVARAMRYRFPRDSVRYLVGRTICRLILSQYLNIEARNLAFHYNRYGRPYIDPSCNRSNLNFNVSHSDNRFLLAVAREREIGIDIEKVKCDFDCLEAAKRFFSPYELDQLEALPPSKHELGFITCWTQKEAYIKAQGMGLSLDLASFNVSLDPKKPAELLSVRSDPSQVLRWKLHTFSPLDGYISTIAAEGKNWQASFYSVERVLNALPALE